MINMKRDVGRYHKLPWGGGQLTIPKDLVKTLNLKNKDKVLMEYDPKKKELKITKL
ncbi:MAG TPA: AbrB/MazE/SpoVT family DNA-binding domain-containing protein [Candidatus Altiarchaeales archaeon]|nr:AbrB/MazE/SpoVT family DNA-binding domain-containing protein [Candidatus Altiarchaeales archaeon]